MARKRAQLPSWDELYGNRTNAMESAVNAYLTPKDEQGEKYDKVEDKYGIEFAQPTETRAAPTINPDRPRALKLAYMKEKETLLIQFRDGTICEYNGIPINMWQELKTTDSTGRYLKYSGIDAMGYNKVSKDKFPEEIGVLFD